VQLFSVGEAGGNDKGETYEQKQSRLPEERYSFHWLSPEKQGPLPVVDDSASSSSTLILQVRTCGETAG
jgi:hypothetical protein